MLSLAKLVQTSRIFLYPRLVTVLQTQSIQSKTLEEKLGLSPKPKRPLTPYIRFIMDTRQKVIQSNPKVSMVEVVKACAKKWTATDEKLKKKLTEEYLKDKEKYLTQLAQYEKKLTGNQKQLLEAAKQDVRETKEKRAFKKKLRKASKPKKPPTGFFRFLIEAYAKNSRGDLSYMDFSRKLAQDWKALPEEKKNVYNQAYKAALVRYKQDLAKWELKMIRLGNVDLVRQEALVEHPDKKPIKTKQVKATK